MADQSDPDTPSPGPSFRLYSPAVDFIENRLPQYHPAFDTRHVHFDPSRGQFMASALTPLQNHSMIPQSMSSSSLVVAPSTQAPSPQQLPRPATGAINGMVFWNEMFPLVMEKLKLEPVPSSVTQSDWGIRHLSTWADVQAKLEMARRQYDFHFGSQHVGSFRRKARSLFDNHAVTLQQGTRLVPEVDMAKPIVGAIKVVLDAYHRASEVREEITTSFEDLPEAFEKIDSCIRTYPSDENIKTALISLLRAIFIAIENSVAFFTSHQAKRAGIAILSGPQYQHRLLQCLNSIKSHSDSLGLQAHMSLAHRVTADNDTMIQQNTSLLAEHGITQSILGSIYQNNTIGMLRISNMFNIVYALLDDLQRKTQLYSPLPRTPSPLRLLIDAPPLWSPYDIWICLQIPDIDVEDLKRVVERTELLLHEDRGRTQQVLGTYHFGNWMRTNDSTKLLVHGNFQSFDEISPLSAVCTLLTHTFRNAGSSCIGLVFFCGCHLIRDEHRGGSVMIRSLISQLLRQFAFTPIQPDPRISLQDLKRGDAEILCDIFRLLVRQLPPDKLVFCLIDGISFYEDEEYLRGMDVVIMALIDLVKPDDMGYTGPRPCFKLLITSPGPTLDVRKMFDPEPDTLLHMASLPRLGEGAGLASLQERLDADMRSRYV